MELGKGQGLRDRIIERSVIEPAWSISVFNFWVLSGGGEEKIGMSLGEKWLKESAFRYLFQEGFNQNVVGFLTRARWTDIEHNAEVTGALIKTNNTMRKQRPGRLLIIIIFW